MERTIKIGGIDCRMKTSAALPRIYRMTLGRDLFLDFSAMITVKKNKKGEEKFFVTDISTLENIAWAMHKHGDNTQPDDVTEWLAQFETPTAVTDAADEIVNMWLDENETTSEEQKKREESTEK